MKIREFTEEVGFYFRFSQMRKDDFKSLTDKELEGLELDVLNRFFTQMLPNGKRSRVFSYTEEVIPVVRDGTTVGRLKGKRLVQEVDPFQPTFDFTLTEYFPPTLENMSKLAGRLWDFIETYMIPIIAPGEKVAKKGGKISTLTIEPEITVGLGNINGKFYLHENWQSKIDEGGLLIERAYLDLCRLLRGCSIGDFYRCNDRSCQKWFYNPTKKERKYCSKKCMWRHRKETEKIQGGEEYRIKKNIKAMTYFCRKRKAWTDREIREHIKQHLEDKIKLSKKQTDEYLKWWDDWWGSKKPGKETK